LQPFVSFSINVSILVNANAIFRIFTIEKIADNLLQESIPLTYTPRRMTKHPEFPLYYVAQAENNTLSYSSRKRLIEEDPAASGQNGRTNGHVSELPAEDFGYPHAAGHWASCVSIIDPVVSKSVLQKIEFEDNEATVSITTVPFSSQDDETFLVVGTAQNLATSPRTFSAGFIHIFRFLEEGRELEFIHRTKVEEPPMAMIGFQGRLLVGGGPNLRLYDLGMKQLLRKAQSQVVPTLVTGLSTQGSRIIVSDVQESVTYVVYKYLENAFIPFVDDAISRWTTCATMVDYETVAGGDKFGNIWLVRCPSKISEEADEEGSGAHLVHERQYLQGTPNRLDLMCHVYVQDIPTSIHKTSLVAGGRDVLVWTGLQGTIGVLISFVSREDVDFFQSLEQHLRIEEPPLAGRDHLMYRGYYVPVKGVIDGDCKLCALFLCFIDLTSLQYVNVFPFFHATRSFLLLASLIALYEKSSGKSRYVFNAPYYKYTPDANTRLGYEK
jgi:splicing factor 3B subunit 3